MPEPAKDRRLLNSVNDVERQRLGGAPTLTMVPSRRSSDR